MLWKSNGDTQKTLLKLDDACLKPFFYISLKNKTRKCDIEGFEPVTSLNGVVDSLS